MESTEKSARRRHIKLTDIIFGALIIIVIVVLTIMLLKQLSLKHEVSTATTVTNRVVRDIKATNAQDVRSLGDSKFQSHNSQAELQNLFQGINKYTSSTPSLVRKTVIRGTQTDSVANIYKYTGKQTVYIRVTVTQESGKWRLVGIAGNNSEAPLLDN